jgi:hypothetical protein
MNDLDLIIAMNHTDNRGRVGTQDPDTPEYERWPGRLTDFMDAKDAALYEPPP